MLKNIFSQTSVINKYKNLIGQINLLESNFNKLTDSELRAKTFELKKKYQIEQNLDSILVESFALVREASLRTLGLRQFDVQLIGGLTLHYGKIAEMNEDTIVVETMAGKIKMEKSSISSELTAKSAAK